MRKSPIHIENVPLPDTALIMGDPARAGVVKNLLASPRLVNEKRGYVIYVGTGPKGREIAVASHGIGGPSMLILVEEMRMLGTETFIRIGTAGSLDPELKPGDVIVSTGASMLPGSCGLSLYYHRVPPPLTPDPELLARIVPALSGMEFRVSASSTFCSDSFYGEDPEILEMAAQMGAKAVDMETAALYGVASIRGLRALSILVISNAIRDGSDEWAPRGLVTKRAIEIARAVLKALDI